MAKLNCLAATGVINFCPAGRGYATDVKHDRRQTASSLNAPWAGA